MAQIPTPALDLAAVQKIRKIAILVALTGLVALSAASQSIGGIDGRWHESVEGFGLAAIILAIVGRAWCTIYIGGRKRAEIVDTGPYSISRNPLYIFSFVGAFGVGAQSGSLTIATAFVMAAILVFHFTVLREEAYLLRTFGASYSRYLARTPRFWPDCSKWHDTDTLEIKPVFFLTTLRDGLAFFIAVPLFEALEKAQEVGWVHILFSLP